MGSAGARRSALVASITGLHFLLSDVQPVVGRVFGGFSTCEAGEKKIKNPCGVTLRLGGEREHGATALSGVYTANKRADGCGEA